MKFNQTRFTALFAAIALLSACTSAPPREAQQKDIKIDDKSFRFGGSYNDKTNDLKLSINGEPLMQGKFPPFTPTQTFNTTYQDVPFSLHCYFGSVLGHNNGVLGIVAGAIQAAKSSASDKCEILYKDAVKDVLYF
ncbi:MAG: hypothetical protein JWM78_3537 [Verrucomicrobiaceae bacterium]|nr:hypothetical protein [Verrucomicrobiaceae bacterium]